MHDEVETGNHRSYLHVIGAGSVVDDRQDNDEREDNDRAFAQRLLEVEARLTTDEQAYHRSRVERFTASQRRRMLALSIDDLVADLRFGKAVSEGQREIKCVLLLTRSAPDEHDDERKLWRADSDQAEHDRVNAMNDRLNKIERAFFDKLAIQAIESRLTDPERKALRLEIATLLGAALEVLAQPYGQVADANHQPLRLDTAESALAE